MSARRTDDEVRAAVRADWSPNWARLALGFRPDEVEVARDEFLRECSRHYEIEEIRKKTGLKSP